VWHRIASRIGTSVREAKRRVSHVEFLRWEVFLNEEYNVHSQESWHLARVVKEITWLRWVVASLFGPGPPEPDTDLKKYLVSFTQEVIDPDDLPDNDDPPPVSVTVPPDHRERMQRSKGAWLVSAGILGNKDGKVRTKTPPPKPRKE
jgi:hypothetical protein